MNQQEALSQVLDAAAKWHSELDAYVIPQADAELIDGDSEQAAYQRQADAIGEALEVLRGAVVVPKAYEEVRVEYPESGSGARLYCGTGPEACTARPSENPNWLWNHAGNAAALAQWIETRVSEPRQTGAQQ